MRYALLVFAAVSLGLAAMAHAETCLSKGNSLGINNSQVLQWETSTQEGFTARGHIEGKVERVYPNETGHQHFTVQIGPKGEEVIEIVYSDDFGTIPSVSVGDSVEGCGDYVTTATTGHGSYTPSILHWTHRADGHSKHDPGYVIVNGTEFGNN